MDKWLTEALESRQIEELSDTNAVYCVVWEHEWYDDGIVLDWRALHRGLAASSSFPSLSVLVSDFMRFGCSGTEADEAMLVTSIDLRAPWSIIPLSEQAQGLSSFFNSRIDQHKGAGGANTKAYRFLTGPTGQRSVRDDVYRVLEDVRRQIVEGGIVCHIFFSCVVVAAREFERLMHHTAAVYKALKTTGFEVNGNGSSFEPRRVLTLQSGTKWSTFALDTLKRKEDVAAFLVDLFYRWVADCHAWLCVSPPLALLQRERRDEYFVDFFTRQVRPHCDAVGLVAAKDIAPEELLEIAGPRLSKKAPPVGPQKWSTLELRLCLCEIGAYETPLGD